MAKNTRTGPVIQYEVEQAVKKNELHEKQQRVCEVVASILELEADKASYANQINEQLKPLRKERDTLLLATQQGIEKVHVDAREHLDYDSFTVKVIQEGTKKVLSVREMTDDEKANPELPDMEPGTEGPDPEPEEAAAASNGASKKAASKTRRVKADATGKPRQRRARAEA
jgi:hypothetical protein